ncbi:MAG TPA: hypothetical protein O0X70_00015 [Methanocorpusculum sp.]|nr:hypothetical protein [Methanocorpusculum sp.]
MTVDEEIEQHLNYAEELIREAESLYSGGNTENAAEKLHDAADELSRAGINLSSGIPKETLEKCDSMPVKILRRVAEEAELMPDFNAAFAAYAPEMEVSMPDAKISASELPVVLHSVYSAEPEKEGNVSALKTLIDLVTGQRRITDFIFGDNGIYSSLADTVSPYLIAGASYVTRDPQKAMEYEDSIPAVINGPVKHLAQLMLALVTSAFFAGLLVLLVKRFVTHKKGNAGFAAGMISLIATNFPLLVSGLREASTELRNIKNIAFS